MNITQNVNSNYILCADIGGTQMRGAIISRNATIVARDTIPTDPFGGIESAGKRLSDLLRSLAKQTDIFSFKGFGLASAGPVQPWNGIYIYPPSLHTWHQQSIQPLLEKYIGIKPIIGHDATLSALAESKFGSHKGSQNLLYVTISTGIGGGAVVHGTLLTGEYGLAGEMGHILVRPGGRRCSVGCDGCFEGNASGTAIAEFARDAVLKNSDTRLMTLADGNINSITSKMVIDSAIAQDKVAKKVVSHVINTIGAGISSLINIFDPKVVYLGGGVVRGLSPMWNEVKNAIISYSLPRYRYAKSVPVEITSLGDDAGILGAMVIVLESGSVQS